MKKYIKESIILILQFFMFYIFPLFAGPTDAMGMVVLIIFATFLLALVLGAVSRQHIKWAWPAACALLFLPTVPIHYNSSALVHALWYLVISAVALVIGSGIGALARKLTKKA